MQVAVRLAFARRVVCLSCSFSSGSTRWLPRTRILLAGAGEALERFQTERQRWRERRAAKERRSRRTAVRNARAERRARERFGRAKSKSPSCSPSDSDANPRHTDWWADANTAAASDFESNRDDDRPTMRAERPSMALKTIEIKSPSKWRAPCSRSIRPKAKTRSKTGRLDFFSHRGIGVPSERVLSDETERDSDEGSAGEGRAPKVKRVFPYLQWRSDPCANGVPLSLQLSAEIDELRRALQGG